MPRINGLFRILIALLLTFSLTGFICDSKSGDDDASCTGAATNMADILWAKHGNEPVLICADLATILPMDAGDITECQTIVGADGYDGLVTGLATHCSEDNWLQADINCAAAAETWDDLVDCAP